MRVPLYVHTDILTESSIYPYSGYIDVLFRGEFATIRCTGQIGLELSIQDAYFVARTIEAQIYNILCSVQELENVDTFFDQFWSSFIDTDLYPEEDIDIDDHIVMMVLWQEFSTDEREEWNGESTCPICISGIGISQIFASIQEESVLWAPIVLQPHPFFRPMGKPDKTLGFLTIHNPILSLGYSSLYTKNLSYTEIQSHLTQRNWELEREQQALEERWKAM